MGDQQPRNTSQSTGGSRVWTFIRIMNVRLRFVVLMVLVGLVVGYWENITNYYDRWTRPAAMTTSHHESTVEYYCPMHPNIIRDEPGNCPICGMPLSERAKGAKQELPEGVLARVQMTPQKVSLGRIGTSTVEYRLLSQEIRTVGFVDYDETRRAFIAARIAGRIEKLFVNYVGSSVKKGDPLVSIYSPDLLVAQQELLSAVRSAAQQKNAGDLAVAAGQSMIQAARRKLQLWGITSEQIDEIVKRGTAETNLTIYSPIAGIVTEKSVLEGNYVEQGKDLYTIADLSRVWMQVKIFEDQISGVRPGTAVQVISTAYPSEVFAGRITFIAYTVDPGTRTVSARVEIDNSEYKLKPGMYATVVIRTALGSVTDLAAASSSAPAASAPQGTGESVADGFAQAYLALTSAMAHDKTDPAALDRLIEAARQLARSGPDAVRANAADASKKLAELSGKDLAKQRALLKPISPKIIDIVKGAGIHKTLYVAYCPMAKAPWLQTAKPIENPYYGSEMFDCGEISGTIEAKAGIEDARFATGYWCPVTPDRLFASALECPLDKFPMKMARVEKVLAVPTSAIIDTGTRKVAYVQSGPETFDMVEVHVGQRAGDYYQVESGLKVDDKVATAGAFLVDAENRLNPAAAAQYFGAAGGPQTGDTPQATGH